MACDMFTVAKTKPKGVKSKAHLAPSFKLGLGEGPHIARMKNVSKLLIGFELAIFFLVRIHDPS